MQNTLSTAPLKTLPDHNRVPAHLRVASVEGIPASEMYQNPYESHSMFEIDNVALETLRFFGGMAAAIAGSAWLIHITGASETVLAVLTK